MASASSRLSADSASTAAWSHLGLDAVVDPGGEHREVGTGAAVAQLLGHALVYLTLQAREAGMVALCVGSVLGGCLMRRCGGLYGLLGGMSRGDGPLPGPGCGRRLLPAAG
jgi:hypothetical protein